MTDNIVQFTGEFITDEDREKDRWVTLAMCATVIAGKPQEEQIWFLREALKKFANVPDEQPPIDDIHQYAAYATRLLLEALTDGSGVMAKASEMAFGRVFGHMFSSERSPFPAEQD